MRVFNWSREKDAVLRETRGISFEDITRLIARGMIAGNYMHPNQKKYPGQKIYEVFYAGYVYLVPYVETENQIFLKTIIPSRKAYKKHVKGARDEKEKN